MLTAMQCLLRAMDAHHGDRPSSSSSRQVRMGSPPSGSSTLICGWAIGVEGGQREAGPAMHVAVRVYISYDFGTVIAKQGRRKGPRHKLQ